MIGLLFGEGPQARSLRFDTSGPGYRS